MPDNLRHTLLLASGLRVLGPDLRAIELLQDAVHLRGESAVGAAEKAIGKLHSNEREELLSCFEDICALLPEEVLAA